MNCLVLKIEILAIRMNEKLRRKRESFSLKRKKKKKRRINLMKT